MFSSIMVFGSGNKFRIRRSQSKASYLAYRREPREKGLSQGSYKRTMSPTGGTIIDTSADNTPEKEPEIIKFPKEPPLEKIFKDPPPEKFQNKELPPPLDRFIKEPPQEKYLKEPPPPPPPALEKYTKEAPPPSYEKALREPEKSVKEPEKEPKKETEEVLVLPPVAAPRSSPQPPPQTEDVVNGVEDDGSAATPGSSSLSKTLPRNYSLSVVPARRTSRPPRAQSDPTQSTAKVEKKSVSASTQDNLDEVMGGEEKGGGATVGRSLSEGWKERSRARTSDAASQTTPSPSPPPPPSSPPPPQPPPQPLPRRHLQEELECDQLSRDLASQLSPSHRLHGILVPGPEVKRSTDYVTGLFRMDVAPRSRSSPVTMATATSTASTATTTAVTPSSPTPTPNQQTNGKSSESLPGNNAYFTTSECKARLMSLVNNNTSQSEPSSMTSLQQKKEELMQRLARKLSVLRAEAVAVSEETEVNEALGSSVTERVERVARPHEAAKFRLHVREVGHITSLLLSLSGRLARAENALLTLPPDHQDRKTLESKRDKLVEQLNEAKRLKSNIDKRSESVSTMLYGYLSGDQYADYDHFIGMKSKLLVDSREITEKIQLGEEQLAALRETLDQVR